MHPASPALLLCALLAGTPALAQDARRQLDAHAHGSGTLAIAIEGNRLQMELEAPASDIIGFEHAPSTAAQKMAVTEAKARLAKAGELFRLSPEAGCKLATATVEVHGAVAAKSGPKPHSHGHAHNPAKSPKTEPKTDDKAPEKAAAADQHSEFRATYVLDCARPGGLATIGFEYFKAFKDAEKLDVTVIGPKGQTQGVVTRDKPVLDLAGTT